MWKKFLLFPLKISLTIEIDTYSGLRSIFNLTGIKMFWIWCPNNFTRYSLDYSIQSWHESPAMNLWINLVKMQLHKSGHSQNISPHFEAKKKYIKWPLHFPCCKFQNHLMNSSVQCINSMAWVKKMKEEKKKKICRERTDWYFQKLPTLAFLKPLPP